MRSNVAGIPELLDNGRCGILVPPRDVQALANAIKTLLTDNLGRQSYADAARRRAEEKFDVWRNAQHLAHILKSTTRSVTDVQVSEGLALKFPAQETTVLE